MKLLNYSKVMVNNPTKLSQVTNQLGQVVSFYDNPNTGSIIAVFHDLGVSSETDFHDTLDFYKDSEYNPVFKDGKIKCAFEFNL